MNNGDFDNIFNWVNKVVLISITDIFGNILLANDKFCETCGYLREELIGKNHRIIKSGYHSEDFYKELWNTIASGSVWRGEICNQRKDGSLYWVDSIITSIHNENNEKQYLSIRFDITLRKLLENEIQQTSKLSLLGEMVAETAHEILNPLFFVSNSLSQLPQLISEPNKFEKKIVTLKKNCKKIEKIVLGLKNYSHKKENKEYLQSSLYLIIEEALVIISDRLKMNEINLTVENNCLSPILCDALEIEQVIINLIINAVDAIKSLEKKWIKIHVSENTESVILRVIDSGFGIPEKIGKKMFEPFFTTKGLGHGTGLGMSIIKKILQEHNATINVDLFKGNTCFEIHFPKIDKAISKALNLYYLDDERELCINFLETFSTDKVMIHIFTNPNQLLSVVQESPPDLIFIDYLLTDTTGDKVAEMIDNKIPKILLTGEVNPTSSYKFDKIISKPFKEIEIINILENYQKGTR